jgi:hypothetical protein
VIVLAREDIEVHLPALETMTEQFQLCEWGIVFLENCIVVWKSWDAPEYPTCPRNPLQ